MVWGPWGRHLFELMRRALTEQRELFVDPLIEAVRLQQAAGIVQQAAYNTPPLRLSYEHATPSSACCAAACSRPTGAHGKLGEYSEYPTGDWKVGVQKMRRRQCASH
jgi:hypothetical protein